MNEYADDFPAHMIYQGDSGPMWEQIGPANWRIKWKGDATILTEIAFRRFGRHLVHCTGATLVQTKPGTYEVTMLFRNVNA